MKFLFENFDILAQAPGAVKKLREMILQFAVQGKLVPQDPNDEPASVLLEKIKAEKEKLIREKKIRKEKPLPSISEDEIPYELPKGWEWVRIGDVLELSEYGTSRKAFDWIEGVPVLGMGNINNNGGLNFNNLKKLHKTSDDLPRLYLKNNDILFNRTNSYELVGKSGLYIGEDDKYTFASYLIRIRFFTEVVPSYAISYLISRKFRKTQIEPKIVQQCGQANFNGTKLKNTLIPIPPISEQKRIIAKIDSLKALCNDLEKHHQEKAEKKLILNKASLHALNNSATKQDFNRNWNYITKNFDLLYSTQENVNNLKQTILQLAVQGKLVPQDPNDEPASVLLEKIKAEKEKLIREKKIRKEKPLPPISEGEIPYELPKDWEWVRFVYLVDYNEKYPIKRGPFGSAIKKAFFVPKGENTYKVYEQKNAIYNNPHLGRYYINEKKFHELKAFETKPGDIIISCSGTIGKVGILSPESEPGIINQALLKICINEKIIIKKYFSMLFESYIMNTDKLSDVKGTAIKNIPAVTVLKEMPSPIPPINEQIRIIKKYDELMIYCDQLESQIKENQKNSEALMNAVLREAFQV